MISKEQQLIIKAISIKKLMLLRGAYFLSFVLFTRGDIYFCTHLYAALKKFMDEFLNIASAQ